MENVIIFINFLFSMYITAYSVLLFLLKLSFSQILLQAKQIAFIFSQGQGSHISILQHTYVFLLAIIQNFLFQEKKNPTIRFLFKIYIFPIFLLKTDNKVCLGHFIFVWKIFYKAVEKIFFIKWKKKNCYVNFIV